jgi:RHS repeat-associated protein
LSSTFGDLVCKSYIERTLWDGDQILIERRADGATGLSSAQLDQETSTGDAYGEVISLNGPGLDAPLAVRKTGRTTLAPFANALGDYEIGTTANGTPTTACSGGTTCPLIDWPGWQENADGLKLSQAALNTWWGNLITEKADASGLKYMRNRYYNPQTGQFTQQDPIGLAGGLNLYGFAGGDPVNYADPFGLCANPLAAGFGSLQCILEDAVGGAKQALSTLGRAAANRVAASFDKLAACLEDVICASAMASGFGEIGILDDLAASAGVAEAGGLTAAARALEKHGRRPGSAFPHAIGNTAAKNAAAQTVVEDILTSPGSRLVNLTSGRFKGGFDIYTPDGRGVRYDAKGKFVGLLEPPR